MEFACSPPPKASLPRAAGGTVVAAARRLREEGRLQRDERTVLCITGNGLKTPEALDGARFETISLSRASLSAFESALEGEKVA